MPSHGVDIIDGIPVILKDGVMTAFQPGLTVPPIRLGTYDSATKAAKWEPVATLNPWLDTFRQSMVARSRK
jgi:hypothetical protein